MTTTRAYVAQHRRRFDFEIDRLTVVNAWKKVKVKNNISQFKPEQIVCIIFKHILEKNAFERERSKPNSICE